MITEQLLKFHCPYLSSSFSAYAVCNEVRNEIQYHSFQKTYCILCILFFKERWITYLWPVRYNPPNFLGNTECVKRMTAHAYGSLVRESGQKIFTPYLVKLQTRTDKNLGLTLKFSMKPPLPSDTPLSPSHDGNVIEDGSPSMHWERADSSFCRPSSRDERVRSLIRKMMNNEQAWVKWYRLIVNEL